jgi:transcriptional regulator with XRE-family HTH domain
VKQGDEMSVQEMAERLKRIMAEQDLTYKETAQKVGRSVTTIQTVLAGRKVSNRTFVKIQLVFSLVG